MQSRPEPSKAVVEMKVNKLTSAGDPAVKVRVDDSLGSPKRIEGCFLEECHVVPLEKNTTGDK